MRVIRLVDAWGHALILQLCFVLCALPVVTVVPAAVALQRSLEDERAGVGSGLMPYLAHLRVAWRQYWCVGLLAVGLTVGTVGGFRFWLPMDAVPARVALGVLAFWLGLGATLYLGLLAVSTRSPDSEGWIALRRAWSVVRSCPLRGLAGFALLWSWLVVLMMVPTLVLVGSGLVPALIVRHTLAGFESDQAVWQPLRR